MIPGRVKAVCGMNWYSHYESPVGRLLLTSDGTALTGLWMETENPEPGEYAPYLPVFQPVCTWLDSYFAGQPGGVNFVMNPAGTVFQKLVWEILAGIPFGTTRTYGEIARQIAGERGRKMSSQAVGQAVGRNPISVIIPCHRVIGAGGRLTGYAGGLDKKQWLLRHEGVALSGGK